MTKTSENPCTCQKTSCGCSASTPQRCRCGAECRCYSECKCAAPCKCSKA